MTGLPAFLADAPTQPFGYYADDHMGNKIARTGLDIDAYTMQVRNLEVMGYEVTSLSLTQQVALMNHETGIR